MPLGRKYFGGGGGFWTGLGYTGIYISIPQVFTRNRTWMLFASVLPNENHIRLAATWKVLFKRKIVNNPLLVFLTRYRYSTNVDMTQIAHSKAN